MNLNLYAFLSYQTNDKSVAGRLKALLSDVGVTSFLAHEDITVSEDWGLEILEEIRKANIFVCVLSKHYLASPWCVQESGIAALRREMTVIPLSLDGTTPPGFLAYIQAVKINPQLLSISDLVPGFLKHDFAKGIDLIIDLIGGSGSFRGAEANFQLILPFVEKLTDRQAKELLERAVSNAQVHHAGLCARDYIPPLLERYGHLLEPEHLNFLKGICAQYPH